jgi:hypothetical protein
LSVSRVRRWRSAGHVALERVQAASALERPKVGGSAFIQGLSILARARDCKPGRAWTPRFLGALQSRFNRAAPVVCGLDGR